ncbi:MAG: anion permease [Solobacterium sp.]|nr:anion permease [Solobacterium sp.]
MNFGLIYVLVVYLIVIALMCSNKFSIATCAVTCATLLQLGGVVTFKEAWAGLSNSSVIMMAAMFVVAAGLSKTSILKKLSGNIIKPGSSDTKIMLGLAFIIFILTSFTNGTNSLNIILPIVYTVCAAQNRPASKFIQNCAILCQVWAGLLPLGGNAGSYNMLNQIVESFGGVGEFNYFTQMLAKLPLGLAVMAVCIFVNHKFAPSFEAEEYQTTGKKETQGLDPKKEKIAIAIFALTIIGLVTSSLTGIIDSTLPCVIGALAMIFFGILKPREVPGNMGISVILCMVCMLPIGTALVNTGGDVLIANGIDKLLGGTNNSFIVLGAFYLVSAVLTQIMYNSTVQNIFRPLAIIAAVSHGWSATALVLAVSIGSSAAMLTPMASNVTALGFNAGHYDMKQYIKGGLVPFIVEFIVFMVTVPLMFPLVK